MHSFIKNQLLYSGIILFAIIASRVALNVAMTPRMILAFTLLSLAMALIPAVSVRYEKKLLAWIYLSGTAIGLLYMAYISLFDVSQGWSDLTSLVGLFTFVLIGLIVGVVAEGIRYMMLRLKK